jgi:hypothetical protein
MKTRSSLRDLNRFANSPSAEALHPITPKAGVLGTPALG